MVSKRPDAFGRCFMYASCLDHVTRHGGVSSHSAPGASSHAWMLTGNDQMLELWHLVQRAGASGLGAWCMARFDQHVRAVMGPACPVALRTRGFV
jgi:hypothetical protein